MLKTKDSSDRDRKKKARKAGGRMQAQTSQSTTHLPRVPDGERRQFIVASRRRRTGARRGRAPQAWQEAHHATADHRQKFVYGPYFAVWGFQGDARQLCQPLLNASILLRRNNRFSNKRSLRQQGNSFVVSLIIDASFQIGDAVHQKRDVGAFASFGTMRGSADEKLTRSSSPLCSCPRQAEVRQPGSVVT